MYTFLQNVKSVPFLGMTNKKLVVNNENLCTRATSTLKFINWSCTEILQFILDVNGQMYCWKSNSNFSQCMITGNFTEMLERS